MRAASALAAASSAFVSLRAAAIAASTAASSPEQGAEGLDPVALARGPVTVNHGLCYDASNINPAVTFVLKGSEKTLY
jgi:hypothetical protein